MTTGGLKLKGMQKLHIVRIYVREQAVLHKELRMVKTYFVLGVY